MTLFLAIHAIGVVSVARAAEIDFEDSVVGTIVFDQFPGVEFPGTPRIVTPVLTSASGTQALSNVDPDKEFNNQPLTIVFSEPQRFVRLAAGLDHSSAAPVQAEFRAYDAADNLVDIVSPIAIGPGPAAATTVLLVEVPDPTIVRVELEYFGAYVEVIDDLEFEVVGSQPPPDTTAPIVSILQPTDGANIAGEFFILAVEVVEDRKLRSASLTISNSAGTNTFALSFGDGPVHTIGPFNTGPLTAGENTIIFTAEDFADNIGTDTITVRRVATAGQLSLPGGPLVIPRGTNGITIPIALEETFPGSLAGRDDIVIAVVQPEEIFGQVVIRDFLNQPDPRSELVLRGRNQALLGPVLVTIQATEVETGRVIDTVSVPASVTPGREIDCSGDSIPMYGTIELADLTADVNAAIDADLAGRDDIKKLNDMSILYRDYEFGAGQLQVSQNFEAEGSGFTATIKFVGNLRVIQERDRIEFTYGFTSVVAESGLFTPGLIEEEFRSRFRDDFVGPFGDGLGVALTARIAEDVPLGLLLLRDIYINSAEFGLGFCIPRALFPGVDGTPVSRIHVQGPLPMALFPDRATAEAPTTDQEGDPQTEPEMADELAEAIVPAAVPMGLCGAGILGMVPFLLLGLVTTKVRRANRPERHSA